MTLWVIIQIVSLYHFKNVIFKNLKYANTLSMSQRVPYTRKFFRRFIFANFMNFKVSQKFINAKIIMQVYLACACIHYEYSNQLNGRVG